MIMIMLMRNSRVIVIKYFVCTDDFGKLSASEISRMSLALYSEINLPQVENDAARLCAQLFDSLPQRIRHSDSFNNLRDVEDRNLAFIAISGKSLLIERS